MSTALHPCHLLKALQMHHLMLHHQHLLMLTMTHLGHLLVNKLPQQVIDVIIPKRCTGGVLTTHESPRALAYISQSPSASRLSL